MVLVVGVVGGVGVVGVVGLVEVVEVVRVVGELKGQLNKLNNDKLKLNNTHPLTSLAAGKNEVVSNCSYLFRRQFHYHSLVAGEGVPCVS